MYIYYYISTHTCIAPNDWWEPHQIFHDILKKHGIVTKGLTDISPPELPQFGLADLHEMLDVLVDEESEDLIHHSLKPKTTTWICHNHGLLPKLLRRWSSEVIWVFTMRVPSHSQVLGKIVLIVCIKVRICLLSLLKYILKWLCGDKNGSGFLNFKGVNFTWMTWAWVILPTSANLATHSCRHFIVEASMFSSVAKIFSTRDLVTLLALVSTYCLRGIYTSVSELSFTEIIFATLRAH